MICKFCGTEMPDGSKVCPNCGTRFQSSGKKRVSKKGKARRRMINTITILVLLIAIVAVGIGIVKLLSSAREVPEAQIPSLETRDNTPNEAAAPDEETAEPEEETKAEEVTEVQQAVIHQPEIVVDNSAALPPVVVEEVKEEPSIPYGNYRLTVDRPKANPSLKHYREVEYTITPDLVEGLTVASTSWVSDNTKVCTAEEVKGVGRVWGWSAGEANVTLTVTLSNGQQLQTNIVVVPKTSKSNSSSSSSSGSSSSGSSTSNPATTQYSGDGYVLKDSDTHVYTQAELSKLSKEQLMYARNEIFARHGYIFKSSKLSNYFNSLDWYNPTTAASDFSYSVFNSTEIKNISTIKKVEKSK